VLTTLLVYHAKLEKRKHVRKQVESIDARVKSELQVVHVGTSEVDSVHDEHWYGHPTHGMNKYSNRSLENYFVIYKQLRTVDFVN